MLDDVSAAATIRSECKKLHKGYLGLMSSSTLYPLESAAKDDCG